MSTSSPGSDPPAADAQAQPLSLRLFVAAGAPHSQAAEANLRRACRELLGDGYRLEVVDVTREPHRALAEKIFVTPTLLRVVPAPQRRIIGELDDPQRLQWALLDRP